MITVMTSARTGINTRPVPVPGRIRVQDTGWGPPECLATWQQRVSDGFCQGQATCTEPPDADGCTTLGGVRLCPGEPLAERLAPPPLAGCRACAGGSN